MSEDHESGGSTLPEISAEQRMSQRRKLADLLASLVIRQHRRRGEYRCEERNAAGTSNAKAANR